MKGSYILLIELKKDILAPIGKLGKKHFSKGYYVYVGSAMNGLEQRIQRHLRRQKKMHWHIDYLLKHAEVQNVFYKESIIREECNIAKILEEALSSISGFGCSDCKCRSHLFHGSLRDVMDVIDKLGVISYQM